MINILKYKLKKLFPKSTFKIRVILTSPDSFWETEIDTLPKQGESIFVKAGGQYLFYLIICKSVVKIDSVYHITDHTGRKFLIRIL